jgi:hypothetical protein
LPPETGFFELRKWLKINDVNFGDMNGGPSLRPFADPTVNARPLDG